MSANAPPARHTASWWGEVGAIVLKDARSELRTRSALGAILAFALTTTVLVSFTGVTYGMGLNQGLVTDPITGQQVIRSFHTLLRAELLSSLYWFILYFSAMAGLPRVFVKEEEMRTAAALRLAARPSAVFAGKLLFNLALLEVVTLLVLPLFVLFFEPRVANWPLFLAHLLVGAAALAGGATLLGAIVSRASNRGYLMVILGFGPLLPILVFCINGSADAIYGKSGNNLVPLVSYLVLMTVVSGLLFERVWSD